MSSTTVANLPTTSAADASSESIMSTSSTPAAASVAAISSTTLSTMLETVKTFVASSTSATTSAQASTTYVSVEATSSAAATTSAATTYSSSPTTAAAPSMVNVADLSSSLRQFGTADYLVFLLMLLICAIVGFYFGFVEKKKKKRNVEQRRGSAALDYLVGGRKMKVLPVALSLVASFVSGISLLGSASEIYVYGTQYAFTLISLALSGVISWLVFLPVLCNLNLTSTYEYFELRFGKGIRLFGSTLFTIGTIFWLPIVIYTPALAFNQVTGVNIHVITPIVCIVCIFYTCVGGLKAVVWTDVIQTIIMIGVIFVVIIKGTYNVGGLGVVWQRNFDSGRIEAPTMTWDPTHRVSMLSVFVGSTIYFTQVNSTSQNIIQRYLSLPGLKQIKWTVFYYMLGLMFLLSACFYNGLLIFATYHDCDPLTTKLAKAKDQLVPLHVMDILGVFPGMPGLFVAGVFSAALSSLSTGLNSLSAVFLEDYIKPLKKTPLTEDQTAFVMRLTVVLIGALCVGLAFVVEFLGTTVLQLTVTLASTTNGPLLGLFVIGLLLPWINSKSALTGSIIAFCIMGWICVKAQLAIATHELVYPEKPVSTQGCTYAFEHAISAANSTLIETAPKTFDQYIYHMSFLWYVLVGSSLTVFFAGLASCFFGYNDPSKMNIELFSPVVRRFIKPTEYISVLADEQTDIMGFEKVTKELKN